MRIEDTDEKRKVDGAVETIINVLRYFNIEFDEGAGFDENAENNKYGPYFQQQRVDIYHAYVKRLVEKGLAYPCFCTEEELEKVRQKQDAKKFLLDITVNMQHAAICHTKKFLPILKQGKNML